MHYRNCTNADVAKHAIKGDSAESSTGNMSASTGHPKYYWGSFLHERLRAITRANMDTITQTIYSYSTPIAWRDRGVWVVPDAKYSVVTSSKHQTHLWQLPNRVDIPEDCGIEEYEAYVSGRIIYSNGKVQKNKKNRRPDSGYDEPIVTLTNKE